jgi:tripartite ATP-independent transporter DctM subunit
MGVFSPTEAAAVGAFGSLVLALSRRRLSWQDFNSCIMDTGKTTAMVFTILIGAMLFGYFLSVTRLPFELADMATGLALNRYIVLGAVLCIYIFLGCLMIPIAMVILTIPIVFPLIKSLGFDLIWFGIITVRLFEIAQITPPVGMTVFVISGVQKDVSMTTIYRGIIPFLIADICHLTLLIIFPQIALFLPSLMS